MDKVVVDKLHLCLSEMIACRDILVHNNVVDELCAHLFAIYVCMRMDDFTKLRLLQTKGAEYASTIKEVKEYRETLLKERKFPDY